MGREKAESDMAIPDCSSESRFNTTPVMWYTEYKQARYIKS